MDARLEAVKRTTFGKNEANRTRAAGKIPGVLYGGALVDGRPQATPISVDPKLLMNVMRAGSGVNTIIGLTVGDEDVRVLMKDYQIDPISGKLLHVDFFRIAMDKLLTVKVPVTVKGESKGVKQQGGLVDFVHREVDIECLPGDIPEHIEIDITDLMLGQAVRLRDVATDPRWKPATDPDIMLVHIVAPRAVVAEASAETAVAGAPAAAEPEIIKKGKPEKGDEKDEKKK
ncbi:MAG: 50S ribosomal protein L25 [Vicinamibacterales bacterium]|nr:50S ribosomal protein L25 [Vicinamibacterales bacterium]